MINKDGFDRLKWEYKNFATENDKLISYAFRCFWIGGEEENQIYGDEADIIKKQYMKAIRTIGDDDADECEDAIINR